MSDKPIPERSVEESESALLACAAKCRAAEAALSEAQDTIDTIKQLESSTLPCGHHYRNGVSKDGGKTGHCIMCTANETISRQTYLMGLASDRRDKLEQQVAQQAATITGLEGRLKAINGALLIAKDVTAAALASIPKVAE